MIRVASVARRFGLAGCLAGVLLFVTAAGAAAEDSATPAAEPPAAADDAAEFCANISDAAGTARSTWEARTLNTLKAEVEARTAELEQKRAELAEWVSRREAFLKLAEDTVVDIYSRMRPDAAASQLAALDPETAAAVLMRLKARTAGAILSEMDTSRAVTLATVISAGGVPPEYGEATR